MRARARLCIPPYQDPRPCSGVLPGKRVVRAGAQGVMEGTLCATFHQDIPLGSASFVCWRIQPEQGCMALRRCHAMQCNARAAWPCVSAVPCSALPRHAVRYQGCVALRECSSVQRNAAPCGAMPGLRGLAGVQCRCCASPAALQAACPRPRTGGARIQICSAC